MYAEVYNQTVVSISPEQILNCLVIWCGMAVIVGAFAKIMVLGTRPRGTLSTLIVGFTSITITSFLMKFMYENMYPDCEFNPVHPLNIFAAILLAAAGMGLYRFLADTIAPKT